MSIISLINSPTPTNVPHFIPRKKTILVTGGAGYIGSHMVLALKDAGYSVVVFDNLSRGNWGSMNSDFYRGDLLSIKDLTICFEKNKIDLVMHFAALAYVNESFEKPDLYYQNNVIGTLNLVSIMQKYGVKMLVYSSSCAVYGEQERTTIDEQHNQVPINPYGRTKLMCERALIDFAHAYELSSISLRYFNAAGCDPKGRAGEHHSPETHVIPLILLEALRVKNGGNPKDSQLKVFGNDFDTPDGSCIRDFVHVSDICRAHLISAERLFCNRALGAEFYNLANGNGFSVFEVIRVCELVSGQNLTYQVANKRKGDPAVLVGNATKALEILDWKPEFESLEKIIETSWLSISKNLKRSII